jgi:hypothetical protein
VTVFALGADRVSAGSDRRAGSKRLVPLPENLRTFAGFFFTRQ